MGIWHDVPFSRVKCNSLPILLPRCFFSPVLLPFTAYVFTFPGSSAALGPARPSFLVRACPSLGLISPHSCFLLPSPSISVFSLALLPHSRPHPLSLLVPRTLVFPYPSTLTVCWYHQPGRFLSSQNLHAYSPSLCLPHLTSIPPNPRP